MVTPYHQQPDYYAALAAERQTRQEAWLGIEPPLCGIAVQPLTLRRLLYLSLAENPLALDRGAPAATPFHLCQFLWVVSAAFRPQASWRRARFHRRALRLDMVALESAIAQYLERSLFDVASAAADGPGNASAPLVDWVSATLHAFAATYGWSPQAILDLPLRQIVQLDRCQRAADPHAAKTLSNPLSGACEARYLEELNGPILAAAAARRAGKPKEPPCHP